MTAGSFALLIVCLLAQGQGSEKPGLANPFYAMDTAFQRPGLSAEGQLDLVKDLGFAGIAWTETSPEQATMTAERAEKRGLKMFAIYCQAKVTPEGQLTHSPQLPKLMEALKGRGTIIWLHIGGLGPQRAKLNDDGTLPPSPYRLVDNQETWINFADVVFIDAPGAGFST